MRGEFIDPFLHLKKTSLPPACVLPLPLQSNTDIFALLEPWLHSSVRALSVYGCNKICDVVYLSIDLLCGL